ncbi:MAG TPA: DUF2917 domain-containing protein [Limnobacter sp.]|uniref:DUF2917 domain-containing protein n=1 Tax=Limnobacter sp. TaxID=2003368 RepID=UPI002ED7FD2C
MIASSSLRMSLSSLLSFRSHGTLRVLRGAIWLTSDGDHRDHLLKAGDEWKLHNNRHVVLESLDADTLLEYRQPGRRRAPDTLGEGLQFVENWGLVKTGWTQAPRSD